MRDAWLASKEVGAVELAAGAAKHLRNTLVSWAVAHSWSRRLLNAAYLRLGPAQREACHREFSKIFRGGAVRGSSGTWKVVFAGRTIQIPLASERFWLDWDTALSVIGQDLEVRETYRALIESPLRPNLFVDIGANYGTHSLLFLVHQIATISFEPNASCHEYFKWLCEANQVTPRLEPVALGESRGRVVLSYPARETWLGSTSAKVGPELACLQELVTQNVEQWRLDDYAAEIGHSRTLIKIDTEGQELSVLQGAERVLQENRPYVIFESWRDAQRADLYRYLDSCGYRVHDLPWSPGEAIAPLTPGPFMASSSLNFVAIPTPVI